MTVNYSAPFSRFPVAEREGPGALRRVSYPFRVTVPADTTITLNQPVPRDGTIERIRVRFYAGTELAVRVFPYVQDERGTRKPLLSFPVGGKQWIDGDDDSFPFEIREPVFIKPKDRIYVEFKNTQLAGGFNYDVAVDIEVDHAAGAWPLLYIPTSGGEQ
jgi:hypothetical protein